MESEKELVTLNHIKADILKIVSHDVVATAIMVAMLTVILLLLNAAFHTIIIPIIIGVLILAFLVETAYVIMCAVKIRKGTYFTIRTDALVKKRDCLPGTKWSSYKPYRLYFHYGYFDIPPRINYSWSYQYAMDEKAIYDTSFVEDTFVLIEHKEKVLMAYNNRFFDVQDKP